MPNSKRLAALCLLLLCAQTKVAAVYNPSTLVLQMVIIPTSDSELSDPAFNPPGMTQVQVPIATFNAQGFAALQAAVPGLTLSPAPAAVAPGVPTGHTETGGASIP